MNKLTQVQSLPTTSGLETEWAILVERKEMDKRRKNS